MPRNRKKVVKIISFVNIPSSLLVKKSENIGDVLNNDHPMPKGRVWKTICWSNMPMFVPIRTDNINLFFSLLSELLKRNLIFNLVIVQRNRIDPNNLISVVKIGVKLLSSKTKRDNKAAITAHSTERHEYVYL